MIIIIKTILLLYTAIVVIVISIIDVFAFDANSNIYSFFF